MFSFSGPWIFHGHYGHAWPSTRQKMLTLFVSSCASTWGWFSPPAAHMRGDQRRLGVFTQRCLPKVQSNCCLSHKWLGTLLTMTTKTISQLGISFWLSFLTLPIMTLSGISPQLRVQLPSEMSPLWWCQLGEHVIGSPMAGHNGTEKKHTPLLVPWRRHSLAPNTRHGARCDIAWFLPCFPPRVGGGPGGQWLGTHGPTWVLWRSILWKPIAWCLQKIHTVVLWEKITTGISGWSTRKLDMKSSLQCK